MRPSPVRRYESPAEIRAIRAWGGDAVGMSTTREALRGVELGLERRRDFVHRQPSRRPDRPTALAQGSARSRHGGERRLADLLTDLSPDFELRFWRGCSTPPRTMSLFQNESLR